MAPPAAEKKWIGRVFSAGLVWIVSNLAWATGGGVITSVLAGMLGLLLGFDGWLLAGFCTGLGLLGFGLIFDRRQRDHGPEQLLNRKRPQAIDADLHALWTGWAVPAHEAANIVLDGSKGALQNHADPARRDLAPLVQRVQDDVSRALSLANNALTGVEDADPDLRVGDFFRQYQGMRTWIAKGFESGTVQPTDLWYAEWLDRDRRFLDEIRRVSATPTHAALLREVKAVGWGEGITHSLPEPVRGAGDEDAEDAEDAQLGSQKPPPQERFHSYGTDPTMLKVLIVADEPHVVRDARFVAVHLTVWNKSNRVVTVTVQPPKYTHGYRGSDVTTDEFDAIDADLESGPDSVVLKPGSPGAEWTRVAGPWDASVPGEYEYTISVFDEFQHEYGVRRLAVPA